MSDTPRQEGSGAAGPEPALGLWNLYFLLKLLLHAQGSLQLRPLFNLARVAFLAYPLQHRGLRGLRLLLALPAAVWLIHAESYLPSWSQLWPSLKLMLDFDLDYLLELAGRLLSPEMLALLVLLLFGYLLLSRFIRLGAVVTAALLFMLVLPERQVSLRQPTVAGNTRQAEATVPASRASGGAAETTLNDKLRAFYREQAGKQAHFAPPASQAPPFDILFLHICSLSWDDMQYAGKTGVLPRFDVLFKRFNTATSYSGPAAIRLLRAGCGQSSHQGLYQPAGAGCYLFDELETLGFGKQLLMNHDGHFDDFTGVLQGNGMNAPPLPLEEVPVAYRAFDGSPIHDDFATLSRWWQQRIRDGQPRVAAYYNTLSLHDGNRFVSGKRSRDSLSGYARRLEKLMADFQRFFRMLEQSGRRVLVVMVPEHGAALKGSRFQLQGMREIPTPDITLVPVGIRLFGPELETPASPVVVQAPVSYLALSEYVAALLAQNPYLPQQYRPEHLVRTLSETRLVSETATAVVMEDESGYWMRLREADDWLPLDQP